MGGLVKWIGPLAWAWLIIIGGLMLTPKGPVPIVFGVGLNTVIAIISIALGVVALATRFMGSAR